jgi:hypothetical protein
MSTASINNKIAIRVSIISNSLVSSCCHQIQYLGYPFFAWLV